MSLRLAPLGQMLALDHAVFIFGMDRDPAPAGLQRRQNIFWLVEQQRAGGRTQKGLDAADTRQSFQLGQGADILRRGASIESMVAIHAALGAGELILDGSAAGG